MSGQHTETISDWIATEEPLEIRLNYHTPTGRKTKSISVTMRTPGNDAELAVGFLFTEGIIQQASDIDGAETIDQKNGNVIMVTAASHLMPDIARLERNFYTTSSCGVCGKSSIEAVRVACNILDTKDNLLIRSSVLAGLQTSLTATQRLFAQTGGLHACALFSPEGEMLIAREDVGRHNAADKLIGAMIASESLPLANHILMLSGRASFELVQKAAMAGVKIIAAVGAPSSLAVQLAADWDITLIGFLRPDRFNIYTGTQRVVIDS